MTSEITRRINQEVGIALPQIEATIGLIGNGATIPFIARYRKEATGNLDEVKIREIADRYIYYGELEGRREAILTAISDQGKLTEDLREKILDCYGKNELEDLYLPYRPKRKSKASVARQKGLEPLADCIEHQDDEATAEERALEFLSFERRVPTVTAAIEGALHIVADRVSENTDYRKWLRETMFRDGAVQARVTKAKKDEKTKYSMYYEYDEPVARIPSHRMLAVRRAAREKILTYSIQVDHEKAISELKSRFTIKPESPYGAMMERAIDDGYHRLLEPSIQNEVRSDLRDRAEGEAIKVFEENLQSLLLAPPAGQIGVVGIDPGLRSGSKMAVVDITGKFLEHQTIYVAEPKKDLEAAEKILVELIGKHKVRGLVIGNGTGSRETQSFVRSIVEKHGLDVFTVLTNEAGASVYSASKQARREFPKLDVTIRGAISIARRLQDPLAELVKIDPKSIGVGQYQHDVDQKKLMFSLGTKVESAVNRVGVDLNTASVDLLKHISGISERLALSIVQHRDAHGEFASREQLREIAGLGDKTFEQAAGFLRIKNGSNPLDRTAVHPESYPLVTKMAESIGLTVDDIVENPERINTIDFSNFEQEAGRLTLRDIRSELLRPAADPRKAFTAPRFRDDVREIADLKDGMELEGTVTNVTDFGAFVDLGVHQDGLVHISELSHQYVSDARRSVHVGQVIKVKVIAVDAALKRISLSLKATLPKPEPRPKPKPRPRPKPVPVRGKPEDRKPRTREAAVRTKKRTKEPPPPELSMEEKIRQLQEKFKGSNR
jgi:uncharacterized protein